MKVNCNKYEEYKKWFIEYTNSFKDVEDELKKYSIELKIKHTFDTVEAMERIIERMNLTDEKYNLAKTIALFHDVGRFNQLKIYGHFNDSKSINHAEESVNVLREKNILCGIDCEIVELIYTAILNHNKFEIDNDVKDEETLFYAKLIRDADKADIYRVLTDKIKVAEDKYFKEVLFLDLKEDYRISNEIYNKAENNEIIKRQDFVTAGDSLVNNLLWARDDIYFNTTIKFLINKDIVKNYYETYTERFNIENDIRHNEICNLVLNHMLERYKSVS